jgi:hypothetical protein
VSSVLIDIIKEVLFRNRDRHANPVLDGPLRPNSRLEECPVVCATVDEPDDIAFSVTGDAYVTSGRKVILFAGGNFHQPNVVGEFEGLATGVAAHPTGGVIVCVTGSGIAFVDGPERRVLRWTNAQGIKCPTAVCLDRAGQIYVCDGSQENTPDRWAYDLMEKRRSGRLLRINPQSGQQEVLASDLAYPNGVCISHDGASLIVSEAWKHRLLRFPITLEGIPAQPEVVMHNLPGYPARLVAHAAGYYLALFALRTQLVDFVLTEDSYRRKMIERIEPAFWISPALRSDGHYLEPVQGGGLRKHGSVKAWAPPRSYGLVVSLDQHFEPVSSLHSRVGGSCHGITGLAVHTGALFAASKGHHKIVRIDAGEPQ